MRVLLVLLVTYFLTTRHLIWAEESESERETEGDVEEDGELSNESNERIEEEQVKNNDENEDVHNNNESERESENEAEEEKEGFSYHKQDRPFIGEARKVIIPNTHPLRRGTNTVDYVGKPDYSFSYGVHDDKSKNSHVRSEKRDGDTLHGEYRVLQPDGFVRIVRYSAHPKTGFQAHVSYAKY